MAEVKFMQHNGIRILLMDYSGTNKDESAKVFEETKKLISTEPENSVLGLVDITESPFDKELISKMKEMAAFNKLYMKVSVVVGVEGIRKVLYKGILKFSGRNNIFLKNTREEALDFLIKQV